MMLLHRHYLFDSCVINAEEFAGSSDHVNFVRLSFSAFLVKELVYRLIGRLPLEIDCHDQEQCFSQRRRASLGNASGLFIFFSGLIWRRINASQSYQRFTAFQFRDISDFSNEL